MMRRKEERKIEDPVVGSKSGCLTVIDIDIEKRQKCKELLKQFNLLETEREAGKYDNQLLYCKIYTELNCPEGDSVSCYLICRCKCGKVHYVSPDGFLYKKHRFCDDIGSSNHNIRNGKGWYYRERSRQLFQQLLENGCGLRKQLFDKKIAKIIPEKDKYYDTDLPIETFETLEIIGRGEDEIRYYGGEANPLSVKGAVLSRKYKCRCHLCGKELYFKYSDFEIRNDEYGVRATDGYYADAKCDCHPVSSFQWRTILLLQENNIPYKAEVSFPDLTGVSGIHHLRFDFAVFDGQGNIKTLIECQGEQHYKKTEKYGDSYSVQKKNDELKRRYVKEHNIPLIEIPYTVNTYEKEKHYLIDKGILSG